MTNRFWRAAIGLAVLAALWTSSARASQPWLVQDINPAGSSGPTALKSIDGRLFFQANDGQHGVEPWVSDPLTGTALVKDIATGPQDAYPRSFTGFGNQVYFSANNGALGHELWRTDGTVAGTELVRDINPGLADSWPGVSSGMADVGGGLFFESYTNTAGYELWRTDGTTGGTTLMRDINAGTAGSSPLNYAVLNGILFFRADDGLPQGNHRELWKSDGTEPGTVMVRDLNPNGGAEPSNLTVFNGAILFEAEDGVHGSELWRTDGTAEGTEMVANIHPTGSSFPGQLRIMNGTLYFVANDGTGSELWKSDGTGPGTTMAVDLNPTGGTAITWLTVVGDRLFFVRPTGGLSSQLWTSDGTGAGTFLLKTFSPQNYHPMVENLTALGETLFFTANDGVHGVELWQSDGTVAGTVLAGDIWPGNEFTFSWPKELRDVGGVLYFSADDGTHGRELWALDPGGVTGVPNAEVAVPDGVRLAANTPNPFQQSTLLRFDLALASAVQVRIYDAAGRHVRSLAEGQHMPAGRNVLRWDGRTDQGAAAQSGIYFYRVETNAAERTGQMVLAR